MSRMRPPDAPREPRMQALDSLAAGAWRQVRGVFTDWIDPV